MQLIALSPECKYGSEADLIVRLFDSGLDRYHLRKPEWDGRQCAGLIHEIPEKFHSRISIHQSYELADEYAVRIHLKEETVLRDHPSVRSRSLHRPEDLAGGSVAGLDYAFLSPIFRSISKPDYGPSWSESELRRALAQPRTLSLYALGGVTPAHLDVATEWGFDGVVLFGCLWKASDPLQVFQCFRKEVS